MKKQILSIGKALNKAEQKTILGGALGGCETDADCEGDPNQPKWCFNEHCRAVCDGVPCTNTDYCEHPYNDPNLNMCGPL
jgi:hypothetical protein